MTRRGPLVCAASCVAWLAALGCATEHPVGSTCPDGICETATLGAGVPCLIESSPVGIVAPEPDTEVLCVRQRVPLLAGMADCRLLLSLDGGPSACAGFGLETTESELGMLCELPQLTLGQRGEAAMRASGWYIEDGSAYDGACAGLADQGVVLNGPLPVGTRIWLHCAKALAHFSDAPPSRRSGRAPVVIAPQGCASLPPLTSRTPDDVGSYCEARIVPGDDFDFQSGTTYVDVRSEQCETGVCLIDASSAPLRVCVEAPAVCPPPVLDLSEVSYCSCRCDAKGDTSRAPCACPAGFTCADVLSETAPAGLAGGYCMRNPAL